METNNSNNSAGFSNFGTLISSGIGVINYTTMKDNLTEKSTIRTVQSSSQVNQKKRKNYYAKLLDMLSRKTESEKRIELFGSDPFK
jgi:hypothetical protein